MNKKLVAAISAGLVVALATSALGETSISLEPMLVLGDDFVPGERVSGAYAKLWRNNRGIAAKVRTRGLTPGIYTLVWRIFNNPEFCYVPFACDILNDHPGEIGDPRVEYSETFATSDFAGRNGLGTFGAGFTEGEWDRSILVGPGLIDSHKAEVHLVILARGPAVDHIAHHQLGRFLQTCAAYDCRNAQISIHRAAP